MRTRLVLILAAAAVLPLGFLAWWTEDELAAEIRTRYRQELLREARLVGEQLSASTFSDSAADRLGRIAGHRITLIRPDGTVVGDSEISARLAETRRKAAEAQEVAALLDRLEEGGAVVDGASEVTHANRAFRQRFGPEEVRGQRLGTLFRDPRISEALEAALGGEEGSCEVPVGDRTVLFSFRPHDGGAVVVLRDLTRLRRLEGIRRDFVANASHELKTPLTSVVGYAEALTDPDLPKEQALTFGRRILENGRRMRKIIDDLLDLSRIEAGAWQPEPRTVELEAVRRRIWRELAPDAEPKDVGLRLDLAPAPAVEADPDAVELVLRNLLVDALRSSRPRVRPARGGTRAASRRTGEPCPAPVIKPLHPCDSNERTQRHVGKMVARRPPHPSGQEGALLANHRPQER